ncbi:hypothetical protein [Natronobiforma cellulositropha]|uniref:hypothetical protein n=1 Tax=Natronobiforma cellulositropha TaxID=1679076 RepID=UPI0021D6059F|nr:hypothetical protein [Natronobiforma cellulositropha]
MAPLEFHPTHAVVFGDVDETTRRETTADAIERVAPLVERIGIRIDTDGFGEAYPAYIERLAATYDRTGAVGAGYDEYCSSNTTDAIALLREILLVDTWHLAVCVQHVRLERDEQTILLYNADHRQFDVDGTTHPAARDRLEEAVDGIDAGVLPRRTLCRWSADGHTYELSPPALCVGRTCFDLRNLRGVAIDDESRTIHLEWERRRPSNPVLATVVTAFERLGPSRPRELRFASAETFESARDGFASVVEAFE